jgi:outer membrane protein OmpA-like peptidoglycan-associated protein
MINKSKNNILVAAACLMMISISAKAQKQEFSIAVGGGLQGIQYNLQHGDASLKPGFQLGLGYMRSIHKRWGIRSGLELGLYRSKASLTQNVLNTTHEIDSENSAFEYRVKANGYHEEQKVWAVNIPLMLQFHPEFNKNGLYAQAGLRLALSVSNKYSTSADQIIATGYYPDYNLEITELPVHGFGTQNGWKGEGEYDLKPSWSVAAEAGWRFKLSANNHLYAGLYIDYGLNDIKKTEGNGALLSYQPNGLAQSQAAGLFTLKEETGNARLMAYGIKLRMGFGSGRLKKKAAPAPVIESAPAPAPVKDTAVAIAPVQVEPIVTDTVIVAETQVDTLTVEEMKILETPFLFGKVGDTSLSDAAKQHASVIAGILKKHQGFNVGIEGHTCNIGSHGVNERIGLARANAVVAALQAEGVDASMLQAISRAHLEPVAPNNTESNRKKNRRVVLKVL